MAKSDDFKDLPPKKEEVVEETPEVVTDTPIETPKPQDKSVDEVSPPSKPPMRKSLENLTNKVYMKAVEAHERIKVCESCDKYLKNAKICGVCKCFMPMKTRLRMAKCPLGKW